MKWPAIVRFDNSDELDAIENERAWEEYAKHIGGNCQLITSDGTVYSVVADSNSYISLKSSDSSLSVDNAVALARRHMAAQAHCCVSKFNASTVEEVIAAIILLEQESP